MSAYGPGGGLFGVARPSTTGLVELLEDAWLSQAPAALAEEFLAGRDQRPKG